MAKVNQNKSPLKGYIASFLTMGLTALGYAAVFPAYRLWDYLLMLGVTALAGRVAFVMGSGLDTSKTAPAMEDLPETGNETVDRITQRGQALLKLIRIENEKIPDEDLSRKMAELETVCQRIFHTVIENPAKAPQIRRFMDYYLPTTLKMLQGYSKMQDRAVTGEAAEAVKQKIRQAMDVVLTASQKQLDTLYQDDILDISTDIDVLETMLKQDNLGANQWGMAQASQSDKEKAK